jgi:hypothetical protein
MRPEPMVLRTWWVTWGAALGYKKRSLLEAVITQFPFLPTIAMPLENNNKFCFRVDPTTGRATIGTPTTSRGDPRVITVNTLGDPYPRNQEVLGPVGQPLMPTDEPSIDRRSGHQLGS